MRSVAIVLALFLAAPAAFAQTKPEWRSWAASDGMPESFIQSIAAAPDGRIWIRHGAVRFMSVLDGFNIVRVPEPRAGTFSGWGIGARVYGTAGNEAWALDGGALVRLQSGRWRIEVPHSADPMLAAVPSGADRVLVLFADHLAEYSPNHRSWSILKRVQDTCLGEFLQMVPGLSLDLWITGTQGVARLELGPGNSAGPWSQFDTGRLGLRDLNNPLPSDAHEVFVTGRVSGANRWAVARWKGPVLEIVYTAGQRDLRGWRGPDGELWVLDAASLLRAEAGRWQPVPRRGALAGTAYDVLTEPGGAFWIGTSEGLARYAGPVWRTPDAVAGLDQPVHSMVEDRQGRLWFSATEYLLELNGAAWRKHALPPGMRSQMPFTRSTWVLPDGRIAIKVREDNAREHVLIFDPKTQKFEFLTHPSGRAIGLMVQRRDGTFWVRTKPGYRFEIWDGTSFRLQFELPSTWKGDDIRCLLEARDGTLWIGGTSAAGQWRNGVLRLLGAADGYTENGAFDFTELHSGEILAGAREKLLRFDGRRWTELRSGMDRVRKIVETRDGVLWVASGSGVYRRRNGNWITNTEEDGLAADIAYAIYQDSQGRIWAGCSPGLSLYHPEADQDAPRVEFAPAVNVSTAGPEGDVPILFAGIDKWKMTAAYRLLFSYRLDHGTWSPFAEQNSARLRSLAPGRHTIQLRGMDRNGNVQAAAASFDLTVVLPWYRHAGFLVVIAAAGLVIAILFGLAVANYRNRGRLMIEMAQARHAAESASRQKGQFLANMSHEIRTPINAVMGMTALALEMAENQEQREYLSTVQKSAESLLAVLNDILDFSKVEAGKLGLEIVDFDLAESLQHVVRVLGVRTNEKGLQLTARSAADVPHFLAGDPHRLQQILFNLAANAIKFTAAGEVRVEARLLSSSAEAVTVEFLVADTGIGVSPEKQQAIFRPFEQEDSSTTRKYGGTGLGLAICTRLVELMQGKIWIESPWLDPDSRRQVAGSAFHFTARFLPGKAPVRETPVSAFTALRGLRILLAEDNLVNQTLAVRILEKRGHTVLVAGNGREALEVLRRNCVDLVLMDVQMPEMDGFEATAAIRESERSAGGHLPIVALTAHAMRGDSDRCLAHGMDAYLAKPIRLDDLDRVLFEVMRATEAGLAS